jgi:YesN/AraC family two-component response regulator
VSVLLGNEYKILTAASGSLGLQVSRAEKGGIDLLLSDFEMPGMNGIDLATAMTIDRPEIKVLLMSAFNGGMLVLNEGWHFLTKPFVSSQLKGLILGLVDPDRNSRFSK